MSPLLSHIQSPDDLRRLSRTQLPALADELREFLRQSLSGVKMPKQIDFREELPRHATGKLYKRLLRDEYWGKTDSKIV
jgi:acyl-coenzyme A synthetase/AMP-(fatty) acid ligase